MPKKKPVYDIDVLRGPAQRYCFLRDNKKLKVVVRHRAIEMGYSRKTPEGETVLAITKLADAIGIAKSQVSNYFNHSHFRQTNRGISQRQLQILCNKVGISLELKITFKEPDND